MFEKYKKLILSQVAAVAAGFAFFLAFMRYQQTGVFQESIFGTFLGFGLLLLAAEVKCLYDYLKSRKNTSVR